MDGHIRKRGKTYCVVLELGYDSEGKRKQKWLSGFTTKSAAQAARAKAIHELNEGRFVIPTGQTLRDFVDEWARDKKATTKPTTWQSYQSKIQYHILPHVGHLKMKEIRAQDIQRLFATIREGGRMDNRGEILSEQTLLHIHRILNNIFERAVKWQIINQNPCILVDKPRPRKFDSEIWTHDQIKQFLAVAKSMRMYSVFYMIHTTGVRLGEALGLRWQDINFEQNLMHIRKEISFVSGGYIVQDVKSDDSNRILPMPKQLKVIFEKVKVEQERRRNVLGDAYCSRLDLVNCTMKGTPYYHSNVRRSWNNIVTRANLPRIRIHDSRRSYASLLFNQGSDPRTVQDLMGHDDPRTTLKIYTKTVPGAKEEAVRRFSEQIGE